jgi:hypothetical protein
VDYRDLRWVFVRSSEPRSRNILLREAGCLWNIVLMFPREHFALQDFCGVSC